MLTFKCKMCGGTLEIQSGSTVAECEYCGAKQTLPKLDDEKRANLYDRANHFRRSNEFDKATAIYEQILNEDGTDAEAYWSLVLCHYGIEYVEDPLSHRRFPTVHRAQFTSIFDDDNYKLALENADSYQRIIYEEEAKAINEIQKGILAISQKEEPFDVFICYKETDDSGKRTHDSVLAQDLYYQLNQEGFRVFFARITLEDKLGSAYEPYIFAALNSAKVMVVLGTKPEFFNAVWVKNEWSRFLSLIKHGEKKMLIPAYKDMDPYNLPKEFSHLQALDMSKLGFTQDLIRGIKKILGYDKKPAAPTVTERVVVQGDGHAQDAAPLLRRAFLFCEDGEFDNADEYAEKVLDINPECAEAYVVKLLIELGFKKPSDLAQCKTPISDSPNYQKAIRFATPQYRETIEGYNNAIIKRIDTARKDEVYARGVELMKLHRYDEAVQYFQNIPTYKDSTQKIDDCKRLKETERRDGIYEIATQLLNAGQFDEAARFFESISDHKDSKEKIKLCGERKETARKDAIYSQAMNRVRPQNADDAAIKKSIEELQTISGYRDVDDQIRTLTVRLEKWYVDKKNAEEAARVRAEEERRTREREAEIKRLKAEANKKKAKKAAAIGIPSVVALATLLVLLFTLIIPMIRYNKADELFNAGKYDEAMEIYQDIGGFSESEQRFAVLNGIEKIDGTNFEDGIKEILAAGVPVKLTYGMCGGDFSGTTYLSAPQEENNNGIVLLSASTRPNITPLATTTASVPETTEFTYNYSDDFSGIQTPGRSGYRFVKWELETYNYQIGGTFEMKLNAVWSEKEYTIEYDLNDGKVTTNNPVEYGIKDDSFTLINPTKTGYTFIGWTGTGLDGLTISVTIEKGSVGDRSYEANWQANTYTITLNPNGGSIANTTITVTYDQTYTLNDPEWTGHTFGGWYEVNKKVTSGTWTRTSNLELTAKWDIVEYDITYNLNSGTNSSSNPAIYTVDDEVILVAPTRTGYTFAGWTYAGQTTPVLSVTIPVETIGDKEYTANWTADSYTLSFDADGGSVTPNSIPVSYDQAYTLPTPVWTGHTFAGWYYNGTQYSSGTWTGLSDITLTAKWTVNTYTVTYDDTAETRANVIVTFNYNYSGSTSSTVTLTNGQTLNYPTVPTRNGYAFAGWYTNSSCTTAYNFSGTITTDTTLYAKWVSMVSSSSATSREYVDIANYNSSSSKKTISITSNSSSSRNYYYFTCYKSGSYTFYANHSSGDFYITVYNATQGTTIINNYNLYGSYSSKSATFSANAGDIIYVSLYNYSYGSNSSGNFYVSGAAYPISTAKASCSTVTGYVYDTSSTASTTVTFGSSHTLPTLTRTGYSFLGWYNGTTKVESGNWSIASNVTLTPKWQAGGNTITLDANGGTVSPNSIAVSYEQVYTLPTPTWTGHTFAGWYYNGTQYSSGTWTGFSDITLTARWTTNDYSITFDDVVEIYSTATITYNYNYSGSTSSTVTLTNGQTLSRPTNPTRSGYVFTGWYTNSSCTTRYDFTGTITGDMTLYAGWKDMSMSYVYTEVQIDPTDYTSSSYAYSVSTGNTSSSYKKHIYLVAEEAGTHYIYFRNAYSSPYYKYYLQIYNLTTGTTISSSTVTSTSFSSRRFACSAGDVIVISLYRDNVGGTSHAYFYFSGFSSPAASSATASSSTVTGYVYDTSSTASTTVTFGSSHTLPTLTRTGYSFLGWYNGTTKVESGDWSIASNVTLTPKWQAGGNTITLDANGGSVTPNSIPVSYDQAYTLPTPVWTGHTFAGWYYNGTQYSSGTWTGLSDITLTARWTTNDYSITFDDVVEINSTATITYNYNYSGSTSSTVTLTNGQKLNYPTNPTRSRYVFTGWYTNSSCTTRYDFTGTITGDMTLYAGWKVMSMSNGYTEVQIYPTDYTSSWYTYSESTDSTSMMYKKHIYLVAEEAGTHYIYFRNAYSSPYYKYYLQIYNLTTGTTISSSTVTSTSFSSRRFACSAGDVIVISLYRDNVGGTSHAYFYFSGFSSPAASSATASLPAAIEYKNNSTYIDSVDYGANYTLPVPTRTGYTFGGWYNGNTKVENGAWNIASNVTLTAKWTANTYTVTFNPNGGSVSPTSKTATYDSSFTLPTPTPTWAGNTFSGWYYDSTKVTSGTWKYTTGMTLTAKWDSVDYTISYTMNGGTNNSSNPSTYTVNDSFTFKDPTKTGYTFLGWTYSGQTTPTKTVTIAEGTMGNLSYTANWKVNDYTVTFDANGGSVTSTSKTVTYDASYTAPTPTRTGYTFAGWYSGSTKYTGGTWKTASNTTLTAKWTANSGIPYVVNHHKQNIAGTGYDAPEVQNLTGTAGASITPSVRSYTGFTSPSARTVTVAPDGTLVVDYYYTRNSYTITMVTNGGNTITAITQKYQSALTMPNATRSGYTFGGWFTNVDLTTAFTSTTMPSSNTTVYAYWTEENKPSDFSYSGSSTITISGYKGADTTVVVPSYIGGKLVKTVGGSAFANKTTITKVVIPSSVATIESGVFAGCTSFQELNVPFIGSSQDFGAAYTVQNSTTYPWTTNASGVLSSSNHGNSTSSEYSITATKDITIFFEYKTSSEANCDKLTILKNGTQLAQTSGSTSYVDYSVQLNAGDILTFRYSKDGSASPYDDCAYIRNIRACAAYSNFGYFFGTTEKTGTTAVVQNTTTYYIPSSLRKVVSATSGIADYAFENCTMLEEIHVAGADYIGKNAFKNCTSLKRLNSTTNGVFNLPEEATEIREYAFYNCSQLVQITTGSDIKNIGQYAFSGCTALSMMNSTIAGSIIMLEGLESVGTYAFQNVANAKTVVVPSTVTSIGASAFSGCSTIESITLPFVGKNATANNAVDSVFGYIFGNNGETEAEGTTKQYYKSSTSYYNFYFIPTTIKSVAITNQAVIPFGAFSNCTFIERIDLSENTTEISAYAFRDCNALNKINTSTANTIILPNGLTKIGTYAFYNVSTVTHLTVPRTVTSISEAAFKGCNSLTDVTLPFVGSAASTNTTSASVYNAFGYIFGYTTSSTEGTVKQLYSGSYYYYYYIPATIRNVTITTATTIPAYAFSEITFIESVTLPETTVAIGDYAFNNCHALKHVNSIGENAINISDSTTKIGKYAFYKCLEYSKLTLGEQTKTIDHYAFNGNASLTTIEFGSSLEKIESYAFAGCGSLTKIGSATANTMVLPDGLLTIDSNAFSNSATTVTTVVVPETVTTIGTSAFYNLNSITDITLPFVGEKNSTSAAYYYVFGYIFGYSSSSAIGRAQNYPGSYYYYIPQTIKNVTITVQTTIPDYAFYNCSFIETISIPLRTSSIGKYAFNNCLGLKRLNSTVDGQFNIPSDVSVIKEYAFYKCLLLENFTNGDITKIEQYAFNGCVSLKKVSLPETTTQIGNYAFGGCAGLQELTFGTNLKTIGIHAFESCAMLSNINSTTAHTAIIPETVTTIGDSAFKGCTEIYHWTLPFVGNTISSTTTSAVFGYIFGYSSSSASGRTQNYPGYYYYISQTIKSVTITKQTAILDYAFQNCSFIESINIPDTTTEIGDHAFHGCSLLKRVNGTKDGEVKIPYLTKVINTYAFTGCSALTELNGDENLVTIGDYAFNSCSNLSKVEFGSELKTIGNYAFASCGSLNQINSETANTFNLPYGLSTIGEYAFQNAKLATKLVVPASVSKIGYFSFNGCNALVDVTLPFVGNTISSTTYSAVFGYIFGYKNTSSSVSNSTQQYSSSYKYYIPKTIRTVTITAQSNIPAYAFQNCSFIETINLLNNATTTAEKAFDNCSAAINMTITPVIAPSWNGTDVATGFESGTGTQADPYVIFSGAQLAYLAQQVNAGVTYENTYFILFADIVLGNEAFSVIGTDADHAFKGIIDGNNHVIRDFTITSDALAVGLFGYFDGTLKNLGIENCTIKATRTTSGPVYVGLIAYSTGMIENCYTRAKVTASCGYTVYAGGMVGYNLGTIKNSYASGNVTATSTNFNAVVGGFVAHNEGTVNNCVAYGNVSATGYTETYSLSGGFVAENEGTITNCYRYTDQTVKHFNKVGATNEEGTVATLSELSTYYASNWSATAWNFSTIYPKFK